MNEVEIDADPCRENVPIDAIIKFFPELKANPFGHQICKVFSTHPNKDHMNFEDFVDMASVFSDRAPIQIKADWAFRVFGNNVLNVPVFYCLMKKIQITKFLPKAFNTFGKNFVIWFFFH